MISLPLEAATLEKLQRATDAANMTPSLLLDEMLRNLVIHHFLGEGSIVIATQVNGVQFERHQLLPVMDQLVSDMRAHKPNDHSPTDRYYAMTITLLEEAAAVFYRHADHDHA